MRAPEYDHIVDGVYTVPLGTYRVEHASPKGKWAGHVFVVAVPDTERVPLLRQSQVLREIALDPLAAAVAYGKQTGTCGICGRKLEKKESIDAGIGPVCASKF